MRGWQVACFEKGCTYLITDSSSRVALIAWHSHWKEQHKRRARADAEDNDHA